MPTIDSIEQLRAIYAALDGPVLFASLAGPYVGRINPRSFKVVVYRYQ